MDGSAAHPDPRLSRTFRRGTRAPAHVALLARAAATREDRHPFRSLAYRPDPGAGGETHRGGGARSRDRRNGAFRADADRRRYPAPQVLVPPVEATAKKTAE